MSPKAVKQKSNTKSIISFCFITLLLTSIVFIPGFVFLSKYLNLKDNYETYDKDYSIDYYLHAALFLLILGTCLLILLIYLFFKKPSPKKDKDTNSSPKEANKLGRMFVDRYTNEHIRKQIYDNSILFMPIVGLLIFALDLILHSFIKAFTDVYPKVSLSSFIHETLENHPVGLIFGITFIIVASVGMLDNTHPMYMLKHIWPACSGKRYSAAEIDKMANDPETIWNNVYKILLTPKTLIGLDRGLTVIDYEDIISINSEKKHHEQSSKYGNYTREWDTYYIVVHTKTNKSLILTEIDNSDIDNLISLINERCDNLELVKDE